MSKLNFSPRAKNTLEYIDRVSEELEKVGAEPIILYSEAGKRGLDAVTELLENGLINVHAYRQNGGVLAGYSMTRRGKIWLSKLEKMKA